MGGRREFLFKFIFHALLIYAFHHREEHASEYLSDGTAY